MSKENIHPEAFVAQGAVVIGDVVLDAGSSVWFNATVRGDRDKVVIGRESNIQDNAVVHVDRGFPVRIGARVTIGHGAVIHGCSIGDGTLVGMGAVVLNGARIGSGCIVGAGALVTQNMVVSDHSLIIGCPGKVVRQVTQEESRENIANALEYVEEAENYRNQRCDGKE